MTIGIYIIGARGNVATLAASGAIALSEGAWPTATGMVTARPEFARAGLADCADFAFGGCDIAATPLTEKAAELARAGMIPHEVLAAINARLSALSERIDLIQRPVPARRGQKPVPPAALAGLYAGLIETFRARSKAERVIVINLTSTEPMVPLDERHETEAAFETALAAGDEKLATSAMLWAWAAFRSGCAFVNFTPSQGAEVPAIAAAAKRLTLPHSGKDGKTGETLLKTVLAPMFVARNLSVLSWLANNYLGNDDGRALHDPAARATKLASKDEALRSLLGGGAHLATDIGYAPSLGDWKTAWDLIHFEGFLGTRMTMQFTWQGCDSALAAPLVLDLARLTDLAWRRGASGEQGWLAPFFKSPLGASEHGFARQMAALFAQIELWAGVPATNRG